MLEEKERGAVRWRVVKSSVYACSGENGPGSRERGGVRSAPAPEQLPLHPSD